MTSILKTVLIPAGSTRSSEHVAGTMEVPGRPIVSQLPVPYRRLQLRTGLSHPPDLTKRSAARLPFVVLAGAFLLLSGNLSGQSESRLEGASQASALAQSLTQNAPSGLIGWSTSAPLCTKLPGSAALAINFSAPSFVAFAPNAYGTVSLICNMPGIMNGLNFTNINTLAFTFSSGTAGLGCGAEVQLVDRTTATPVSRWATDPFTFYSGIWTVEIALARLPQNHTYDVEFYLHRPQSAVHSCSPAAYAGFLERIAVIP